MMFKINFNFLNYILIFQIYFQVFFLSFEKFKMNRDLKQSKLDLNIFKQKRNLEQREEISNL